MASPQSTAPKRARPSRPLRRFTVRHANSTLPLVKRVVSDIVRTHESATRLQSRLNDSMPAREQQRLQTDLDHDITRLQDFLAELSNIGCEMKDFQSGLVDFVGRHRGHDVCLCWKLGEEQINWWHEVNDGFAGRQPIASLQEDE